MSSSYYDKQSAMTNIAAWLIQEGWNCYDYTPYRGAGPGEDYGTSAHWSGVATHPNHPETVLIVGADPGTSGKAHTRHESVQGPNCEKCLGTGIATGELTYEQALLDPANAHETKHDRAQGFTTYIIGARGLEAPGVSRHNYHADGSPKCLKCQGRGFRYVQRVEMLWTYPVFKPLDKGVFWSLQRRGVTLEQDRKYNIYGGYGDKPRQAIDAFIKNINRLLANAAVVNTTTPSVSAEMPITVTYENNWTWVQFNRRFSRDEYVAFVNRFAGAWSKKRGQVYMTREIPVTEFLTYFGIKEPLSSEMMEDQQKAPDYVAIESEIIESEIEELPSITKADQLAIMYGSQLVGTAEVEKVERIAEQLRETVRVQVTEEAPFLNEHPELLAGVVDDLAKELVMEIAAKHAPPPVEETPTRRQYLKALEDVEALF